MKHFSKQLHIFSHNCLWDYHLVPSVILDKITNVFVELHNVEWCTCFYILDFLDHFALLHILMSWSSCNVAQHPLGDHLSISYSGAGNSFPLKTKTTSLNQAWLTHLDEAGKNIIIHVDILRQTNDEIGALVEVWDWDEPVWLFEVTPMCTWHSQQIVNS